MNTTKLPHSASPAQQSFSFDVSKSRQLLLDFTPAQKRSLLARVHRGRIYCRAFTRSQIALAFAAASTCAPAPVVRQAPVAERVDSYHWRVGGALLAAIGGGSDLAVDSGQGDASAASPPPGGLCPLSGRSPLLLDTSRFVLTDAMQRRVYAGLYATKEHQKAHRLSRCRRYYWEGICSACGTVGVLVSRCGLTRLCLFCARADSQKWRARTFALLDSAPASSYVFLTYSLRMPADDFPRERHVALLGRVFRAMWKSAKAFHFDRGVRAFEFGEKRGTPHCHMLLGGAADAWFPRHRAMLTLLRATRQDLPGHRLPRRIELAVTVAAKSLEKAQIPTARGRMRRHGVAAIQEARATVESWAKERGASWYTDVRRTYARDENGKRSRDDVKSAVAEALKYLTKMHTAEPEFLIHLDEILQGRRRVELLGKWRGARPEPECAEKRCECGGAMVFGRIVDSWTGEYADLEDPDLKHARWAFMSHRSSRGPPS